MPSDANGVYSLPSGYEAVTGEIIQASQHNPPLEDLASATSARLMRSGAAPMTGPLKISDGSVGSPGLKFNTDGTTGFYKTTGGIGISVGGTKVAEFTSSGASRLLGELIPYTGLTAQDGFVLPYGQTLSRTTYADLWAFAQDEIAGGNTFYNNGDGSTTFGIGDLRGRVVAGKDNMGGTPASRLTTAGASVDGSTLGAAGGAETGTIARANLPNVSPTFTGTQDTVTVTSTRADVNVDHVQANSGSNAPIDIPFGRQALTSTGLFTPRGTVQSLNGGVTQTAMAITQPTLVCNYLLYAGA